jgi:hypothetical protein
MRIIISSVIILVVAISIINCDGNSINSPKDIVFPESNVSYLYEVNPFLTVTCGFGGCHNFSNAGDVNLTDYFETMKSPGLVIPGNPDGSYLIQIIEERIPHITYYERSFITTNHIQGMRKWVKEGALNN